MALSKRNKKSTSFCADCYGNNPFQQNEGMKAFASMYPTTNCGGCKDTPYPSPGQGNCCEEPEHSGIYTSGCIEGYGTKCDPLRIKEDCLPSGGCDCPSANFDCEVSGETQSFCDWIKDHEERIDFIEENFCELVEECLSATPELTCTVDKIRVCDYVITPENSFRSGQVCVTLPETITANDNRTSNIGNAGGEMSNFQVIVSLSSEYSFVLYQGGIPPYTISRSTILNNLNTALLDGICDIEISETGFCVSNPQVGDILAIALNYISGAPGNFCNGISFTSDKTPESPSGCYYDTVFRYIKTQNRFEFQIEDTWYDATSELVDNTFQRLDFFKTVSNYRILDTNNNIIETNEVEPSACEYVESALPICDYLFSTKNQTKCFTITFDEPIFEGYNRVVNLLINSSNIQSQSNGYIFTVDFSENSQPTYEEFLDIIEAGFYDFEGRLSLQRNNNVFTICDSQFDYALNMDLTISLQYEEAFVEGEEPYDFNPDIIHLGGFYYTDIQDYGDLYLISAIYNPDFIGLELNNGDLWVPLEINENGTYSIFQTNQVYPEYKILYGDDTSEIIPIIPTNCEEPQDGSITAPICEFIHDHEHRITELESQVTEITEVVQDIETLYTSNGIVEEDRTVDMDGNDLSFVNGKFLNFEFEGTLNPLNDAVVKVLGNNTGTGIGLFLGNVWANLFASTGTYINAGGANYVNGFDIVGTGTSVGGDITGKSLGTGTGLYLNGETQNSNAQFPGVRLRGRNNGGTFDDVIVEPVFGKMSILNIPDGTPQSTYGRNSAGRLIKYTTPTIPDVSGFVPYTGAVADVNLGDKKLITDAVQFDLTPSATPSVGQLQWNDTDGTLDLGMKGGAVTQQIGMEQYIRAKSSTNAGISEGYIYYITGATGGNQEVALAQANNSLTSKSTIGVATETVAGGGKAFITTFGIVRGLPDSLFTGVNEGDTLYLSATTPGTFQNTAPTQPNHRIRIGYCARKQSNNNEIFVSVQLGLDLGELCNVSTPSPSNGDIIRYNSGTLVWESQTFPTIPTVPTNVSAFTNDANYITSAALSPLAFFSGSAGHTGDTNETIVQTIAIPSTAWATNAMYQIIARVVKSGSSGTMTVKVRLNGTPDLTGTPITLMEFLTSAASGTFAVNRIFTKTGTSFEYSTLTTISDLAAASATATATQSTAATTYIMLTVQNSANGGVGTFTSASIQRQ